jgi:GNAT superfamily N-acetyltransferase
METKILRSGDEAVLARVAPGVFDDPIDARAAEAFLADARHHLAVAIDEGVVVGFASAVHYLHPDKPRPEMWINEVGVAPTHRGRGIARAILRALLDTARGLGCTEAWVLTDRGNTPARKLYASVGGTEFDGDTVGYGFELDEEEAG